MSNIQTFHIIDAVESAGADVLRLLSSSRDDNERQHVIVEISFHDELLTQVDAAINEFDRAERCIHEHDCCGNWYFDGAKLKHVENSEVDSEGYQHKTAQVHYSWTLNV